MGNNDLIDPLGRRITFHNHTWYGHILRAHPELKSERSRIEETLRRPNKICLSISSPELRYYYISANRTGLFLRVVVDIQKGHVRTAHYIRTLEGGPVEWSA